MNRHVRRRRLISYQVVHLRGVYSDCLAANSRPASDALTAVAVLHYPTLRPSTGGLRELTARRAQRHQLRRLVVGGDGGGSTAPERPRPAAGVRSSRSAPSSTICRSSIPTTPLASMSCSMSGWSTTFSAWHEDDDSDKSSFRDAPWLPQPPGHRRAACSRPARR